MFSICLIYDFLKPLKFWAHLDNFYFHSWNNENKSCLNELKFLKPSENHKLSICWKFQLSISCGTQKSAKIPLSVAKMIWSFIPKFAKWMHDKSICKGGSTVASKCRNVKKQIRKIKSLTQINGKPGSTVIIGMTI